MSNDECYICKGNGWDLVRPCINKNCTARAHSQCLRNQIIYNNGVCGCCRQPIMIESGLKYKECCEYFTKVIYVLVMLIGGTALTVLHAEGASLNGNITCVNDDFPCPDTITIILTVGLCFIFWQLPFLGKSCGCSRNIFICASVKNKIKYKPYITMFIMFLFTNLLVMISHFIGQLIISYKYNEHSFYNARTCIWGYVVYLIIIAASIVIAINCCIIGCIVSCTRSNYSTRNYGVKVIDETTRLF